jgi:hypothetical protein
MSALLLPHYKAHDLAGHQALHLVLLLLPRMTSMIPPA